MQYKLHSAQSFLSVLGLVRRRIAANIYKNPVFYLFDKNRKRIEREVKDLNPISRLGSGELNLSRRDRRRIKKQVKNLNPWFYQVDIFGVRVKPGIYPTKFKRDLSTYGLINRQIYRKVLLVKEVTKRFDFTDARILDLGCNCGYWSSIYITRYGADSLVGIEGSEIYVKQADLYYKSLGIREKATFIFDNIMEYNYDQWRDSPFDFVLCAGILYHVKNHEELLTRISQVNRKALVIDTRISEEGDEYIEPGNLCFNAIEATRDKKVPTKDGLIRTLRELGYETEIISPIFKNLYGVQGDDDYTTGRRICMFCRKKKIG